jgi:SAM-dependent methyltransferase
VARDIYDSLLGAAYSAYMERPRLSRVVGGLFWGSNTSLYYRSMGAIREVEEGGTVVDCPCGAGVALRELDRDKRIRYVGVDLSPAMLRRARERVAARGLDQVELMRGDATAIPLPDDTADLFLSYWGLHCFADPAAALVDAARVVRPGGRLVGSSLVLGTDTLRQRLFVRPELSAYGPVGTQAEVEAWVAEAGFAQARFRRSGPMLFFDARRGN